MMLPSHKLKIYPHGFLYLETCRAFMFVSPGNSQISMDRKSLKHVRKQYVSLWFLRVSGIGNNLFFVVQSCHITLFGKVWLHTCCTSYYMDTLCRLNIQCRYLLRPPVGIYIWNACYISSIILIKYTFPLIITIIDTALILSGYIMCSHMIIIIANIK